MASKIARAAFLFILAATVVSWAVSISKSSPVEPPSEQPAEAWSIYC